MRPGSLTITSLLLFSLLYLAPQPADAQQYGYWQQEADYEMEVDMDVEHHRFSGEQTLTYTNHSPDTLDRVFYHLYFNAFQPGSMMDVRSRTIQDPDRRVEDRIYHLDEDEIGYQKVNRLTQDGVEVTWDITDTVMEVQLAEPILPGETVVFEMDFEAQVPVQIRRTGRHNAEGIEYSMAQWYPKMAEFDFMGWHNHPYIGREFHGVFGTFDVTIHIDRSYVVAATGYLQNPEEVGYGYESEGMEVNRPSGDKLTWHFKTDQQHDFMWAADPDYHHATAQVPDGPLLRFFYQTDPVAEDASSDRQEELLENWEKLPDYTSRAFEYMNSHFGIYPYEEYVVIQGGDGGMEYIMGTLITGNRSFESLVGVTVHELVHAWYQGVLATNESYYHWMDEGFTVYASNRIMTDLFGDDTSDTMDRNYDNYYRIVAAGIEEPMDRHADHYERNVAYAIASYSKGAIFLNQLGYIVGEETLEKGLRRFYDEWAFKHPTGYDFIRVMEKESGMHLYWYYEYWVKSTRTIDYEIQSVESNGDETEVVLGRHGEMPMPIDLEVEYSDGSIEHFYIPKVTMWGAKENEFPDIPRTDLEPWPWVDPSYSLQIPAPRDQIERIEIDPSGRMADIHQEANIWTQPDE